VIALVKKAVTGAGARVAVSRHWEIGGDGARELAQAVTAACEEKNDFRFLYSAETPLRERIRCIAQEVYGAEDVVYSPQAGEKAAFFEKEPAFKSFGTCMVKTHLSLSHDPDLKGRPQGWTLPIRDILLYQGAGLVVPVAGDIKLMPGTASDPAFRYIDVDVNTGKVQGLF
jgi:formate--tetrahydrofolate ligase